jgi:non-heme chloroperoxidase
MKTLARLIVGLLLAVLAGGTPAQVPKIGNTARETSPPPAKVQTLLTARVNGVELHYLDRGQGEPIVFVHGGLTDYREWEPVAKQLQNEYRTITYSRRYNFPNDNPLSMTDHSAIVEAADLAALNRYLHLGPMHVVGVSYGAYTAL